MPLCMPVQVRPVGAEIIAFLVVAEMTVIKIGAAYSIAKQQPGRILGISFR